MEKYVAAADEVVALALPNGAAAQVPRMDMEGRISRPPAIRKPPAAGCHSPRRNVKLEQEIQWDGDYQIEVEYSIHGASEATTDEAQLEVRRRERKSAKPR